MEIPTLSTSTTFPQHLTLFLVEEDGTCLPKLLLWALAPHLRVAFIFFSTWRSSPDGRVINSSSLGFDSGFPNSPCHWTFSGICHGEGLFLRTFLIARILTHYQTLFVGEVPRYYRPLLSLPQGFESRQTLNPTARYKVREYLMM